MPTGSCHDHAACQYEASTLVAVAPVLYTVSCSSAAACFYVEASFHHKLPWPRF
jgi:hypothetical protein